MVEGLAKEEIAEELVPLRNQINQMQQTLSQLQSAHQSVPVFLTPQNQVQATVLAQQMRQFSTQLQSQQTQALQQLHQSIQQAALMLNQTSQHVQAFQMYKSNGAVDFPIPAATRSNRTAKRHTFINVALFFPQYT